MKHPVRRHLSFAIAVSLGLCLYSLVDAAVTPTGEVRQPRNIYELVYAFEHTFPNILEGEDLKLYRTLSPAELRLDHPALYERISIDVKGWTDEWIEHVERSVEPIPSGKLSAARESATQVDGILKTYFGSKGWPYRPLRVVFLPPRVFLDERNRGSITGGMYIPYYPDAFFATVDWPIPEQLVLVHEGLHFNASVRPFGGRLVEGITETATHYLLLKYDLMDERQIARSGTYPDERKVVALIIDEIVKRTSAGHDEALELFLAAYVTGKQDGMTRVFGDEPWQEVLRLSHTSEDWQTHKIKKALGIKG